MCNKTFAHIYGLQRHMISHEESANVRKFKCDICSKAFKFKHHLKVSGVAAEDVRHTNQRARRANGRPARWKCGRRTLTEAD